MLSSRPTPGGVEPQLLNLRLGRHEVARHHHVLVEVTEGHLHALLAHRDHRALVLRLALGVLLAVGKAGHRVGRHGYPCLRPVDAGLERSGAINELALVVVANSLAEVPDVPVLVLGIPVVGDLDRDALFADHVTDHAGLDTVGDRLGLVGHRDNHLLLVPFVSVSP
jgi:hypothetical protein